MITSVIVSIIGESNTCIISWSSEVVRQQTQTITSGRFDSWQILRRDGPTTIKHITFWWLTVVGRYCNISPTLVVGTVTSNAVKLPWVMTHDTTFSNCSRYWNRLLEELCPTPKNKSPYYMRIYHYAPKKNIYGFNIFQ